MLQPIIINLTQYSNDFRLRTTEQTSQIWCPIRLRWIQLTPEELVRQSVIQFLLQKRGINRGRIGVEKGIKVNGMLKRFDVLVMAPSGKPQMLIECKSFDISITQALFDQLSSYNQALQAPWIWATNGHISYVCKISPEGEYDFVTKEFPTI